MKLIGITQQLLEIKRYHEVRSNLDIRWYSLLNSLNLLPLPLPLDIGISSYDNFNISGLIITGGGDLYSQSKDELSLRRDNYEKECIKYAIKNSIPVIGICRGMQLIAEYFDSTLKKVENHVGVRHGFKTKKNSRFSHIFDKINNVNSFHESSIDVIGSELEVVGFSPNDNIVEAISHKKHSIIGQMWHPERENPFDENQSKVISSFFDA
jgi:putative glutamine amidotransferase